MTLYANIPEELQARAQWVLWRWGERDGKPTKVPYQVRTPARKASSTNPSTWSTFAEAVAAADQADGIGFVFSAEDPYAGVDFDEVTPAITDAIAALDSYTETSVRSHGVHVIVKGSLAGISRRRHGKVEVYDLGRYFCMTGAHVEGIAHDHQ